VTLVAAVQTMGIDCPVDLDIEEEDEIDNRELSLGARFLMGMVFGSLLFLDLCLGYFWHLAAKGFCTEMACQLFCIIMAEVFHQEISFGDVNEC
jgi:hypothetical protein